VGGSKGFEGISVYDATKAAIRSFARSWTVDLKNRKIRVNAVSPGPIATPMAHKWCLRRFYRYQLGQYLMPMNKKEVLSLV
jgi:NAD(P)-dependent dehydrogenase (short-subunit alcohol dehydrogenase family)